MDQADHGGRPALGHPWGAAQFGSSFFMITGFHGTHVTIGVIFLIAIARKVWRETSTSKGAVFFTSRKGYYEIVEIHRPLLALRGSCVGVHLCTFLSLVRSAHDKRSGSSGRAATFAADSRA